MFKKAPVWIKLVAAIVFLPIILLYIVFANMKPRQVGSIAFGAFIGFILAIMVYSSTNPYWIRDEGFSGFFTKEANSYPAVFCFFGVIGIVFTVSEIAVTVSAELSRKSDERERKERIASAAITEEEKERLLHSTPTPEVKKWIKEMKKDRKKEKKRIEKMEKQK